MPIYLIAGFYFVLCLGAGAIADRSYTSKPWNRILYMLVWPAMFFGFGFLSIAVAVTDFVATILLGPVDK